MAERVERQRNDLHGHFTSRGGPQLNGIVIETGGGHVNIGCASPDQTTLYKQCLRDLRHTDPRNDKKRIEGSKDKLLEGSCSWVVDDPAFQNWWEHDDPHLLWIHGDPGKGKTMMMFSLYSEISSRIKATGSEAVVSYFFCQSTDPHLNHAVAVLRGLIFLLITQDKQTLLPHLREKLDETEDLEGSPNLLYALFQMLIDLSIESRFSKVYLMIDALDECNSELSLLLREITRSESLSYKIKWLVTSRNELLIKEGLSSHERPCLSLELNSTHVSQAVNAFIRAKITELAQRKRYDAELTAKIEKYLSDKADGTFLWVALVCKKLGEVAAWKTLSVLKELPPGLEPLYEQMIKQIRHLNDVEDVEFCRQILSSATLTYHPLHLNEMAAIAGLPKEFFNKPESLKDLVEQCGSFLAVRDETIYFVHQSAKDYLTKDSGIFPLGQAEEHRKIAYQSLQLMSNTLKMDICSLRIPGTLLEELSHVNQGPLVHIRYACCYWIHHLRDASHLQHNQLGLCDGGEVYTFLQEHFLHWLEALSLMGNVSNGAVMVRILEEMLTHEPNTNSLLLAIIHDAKRFILRFGSIIEKAPLQTYCAALAFSPQKSEIRQQFWAQRHPRIKSALHAEETWNPSQGTLEGHSGAVWSVAFSPDGKLVASGSDDKTVRLWDAGTGAARGTLAGHSGDVWSVAFSPDGKLVASGSSDKTVRLWDASTGAAQGTLAGHSDYVRSVAFSPDGKLVASGSDDKTVRLWDASTGAARGTLAGHSGYVRSVAFSPDGKLVASGSDDKTVRLWDAGTGAAQGTLAGHSDYVRSVAFSPDGKLVASGSDDKTVRLWDASTGAARGTLAGHSGYVRSVAFSPDGKLVASGSSDMTVRLWDASTGAARGTLAGHSGYVRSVAFSPDGKLVASGSDDKTVRLWDASTGAARGTLAGHSDDVWSVAFSPDGKLVASGSSDKTVRLWDAGTGAARGTLAGHSGYVRSVAFSPDGKLVASGSSDMTVRLWDASTGAAQGALTGHSDYVWSVAFSPDGKLVASGSSDKTVRLWDASTGAARGTLAGHSGYVRSVAFSPDGKLVASGSSDKTVRLWDAGTGAARGTLAGHSDYVWSVAFSPDGKLVASGSDDKTVRLWDAGTGAARGALTVDTVIRSLSFSSSGQYLKTDRGILDLSSLLSNVSSCSLDCRLQIFVSDNWVAVEEENIIWLPPDYRATCVANWNRMVVLGHSSGGMSFLEFEG